MEQGSVNDFSAGRQGPHKSEAEKKMRDIAWRVVHDEFFRRGIRPRDYPNVKERNWVELRKRNPESFSLSLLLHIAEKIGVVHRVIDALPEAKK